MPLSLGTSFGNARLGISTKWPKGISLGANIPLGVDPIKAKNNLLEKSRGFTVGRNVFHAVAMLPLAVPGMVLGLAYIFFFNHHIFNNLTYFW